MTEPDGPAGRRGNGLAASRYVLLADVDPAVGAELLVALARAGIAAYVEPADWPGQDRLFVADAERADARSVVESAARAAGAEFGSPSVAPPRTSGRPADPETAAAFDELVAGWHVDTVAAVRAAERDLTREDADWRARLVPGPVPDEEEDEHYVPPPPPPLPRLAGATVRALFVLAASVAVLAFGARLGLDPDLRLLVGVGGLLCGAALLAMRLREQPEPDDDDDGAVI